MTVLGAILAGGVPRRFGGDRAAAPIGDRTLLDRVAAMLAPQVDAVVVVGREADEIASVSDWPGPGLGPVAGLAGAMRFAQARGHEVIVTVGCDTLDLPRDLVASLAGHGPAVADRHPVIGSWPAELFFATVAYLSSGQRSVAGLAEQVGARRVRLPTPPTTIATQADLTRWRRARQARARAAREMRLAG